MRRSRIATLTRDKRQGRSGQDHDGEMAKADDSLLPFEGMPDKQLERAFADRVAIRRSAEVRSTNCDAAVAARLDYGSVG